MYELVPIATAPELDSEASARVVEDWPEFIFHDEGVTPYLERRAQYFRDWEFYLIDDDRRFIAGCWGVLIRWDGTVADLPGGFTGSMARAVEEHEAGAVPNTFVLMAAAVRSDEQGRGHAGRVITAVRERAVAAGLPQVIAPVRPTSKSRYPLIPIEEFMGWTRVRAAARPVDPYARPAGRIHPGAGAGQPDDDRDGGRVGELDRAGVVRDRELRDPGRAGGALDRPGRPIAGSTASRTSGCGTPDAALSAREGKPLVHRSARSDESAERFPQANGHR